ncbi:uncharacterized protein PRCAT00001262001 [Priceomyces carsonii]|uniref:uncharacterized protein n=1 Tax=Priceomyces carsonii TaxID=28549 RepID=UPI002ED965A4|nr:unnamed protein product [Priceomyces carsonii]
MKELERKRKSRVIDNEHVNKLSSEKASYDESSYSTRITRAITACKRCRSKKIRCDKQFPKCTNCKKAGRHIDCLSLDPGTGEIVSRSYLYDLNLKVKTLSEELERLKREKSVSYALNGGHPESLLSNRSQKQGYNLENLPPRNFVERCLQIFFLEINIQLPIVHRDYYLIQYFRPLYGEIGEDLWTKVIGEPINYCENSDINSSSSEPPKECCLFFLNMILAISTSARQDEFSTLVSNSYKDEAMCYIDAIRKNSEVNHDEFEMIEEVQRLLLISLYSVMRLCSPSAWYLVGTCCRLCLDLSLHCEPQLMKGRKQHGLSFVHEMRRRLFWCCYSLDRQISINLKRPFGIDESQIDVNFPSMLDDLVVLPEEFKRECYHTATFSKSMSLHFIKLRRVQGKIFNYLNDKSKRIDLRTTNEDGDIVVSATDDSNDVESDIHALNKWKNSTLLDLNEWYDNIPKTVSDQKFISAVLRLNYHLTLIKIFGISPIIPMITDYDHYHVLYNSGKEIIYTYSQIYHDQQKHCSWIAANILYLGISYYLYLIANSPEIRTYVDSPSFKTTYELATTGFNGLEADCAEKVKSYQQKIKVWNEKVSKICGFEQDIKSSDKFSKISKPIASQLIDKSQSSPHVVETRIKVNSNSWSLGEKHEVDMNTGSEFLSDFFNPEVDSSLVSLIDNSRFSDLVGDNQIGEGIYLRFNQERFSNPICIADPLLALNSKLNKTDMYGPH